MKQFKIEFLLHVNKLDSIGHVCLVESDVDLTELSFSLLSEAKEIKSRLEKYNCKDLRVTELNEKDVNKNTISDKFTICKKDL